MNLEKGKGHGDYCRDNFLSVFLFFLTRLIASDELTISNLRESSFVAQAELGMK